MTKRIRIASALVVGAGIVLGALYLRNDMPQEGGSVVAVATSTVPRSYITGGDWESEIATMTLRAAEDAPEINIEGAASSTPDNTLTSSFARSFFENYTRANLSGALTKDNQQLFLQASIADLMQKTSDTPYTRDDVMVGQSSDAALRDYGNTIAEITVRYSGGNTENELDILQRAMQSKNAEDFAKLTNIANAYSHILTDTLTVAAPPDLIDAHLALVNAYQAIASDVHAFADAQKDPVNALLHVKRYQNDAQALAASVSQIYHYLAEQGVRYADDEPGALFRTGIQ